MAFNNQSLAAEPSTGVHVWGQEWVTSQARRSLSAEDNCLVKRSELLTANTLSLGGMGASQRRRA